MDEIAQRYMRDFLVFASTINSILHHLFQQYRALASEQIYSSVLGRTFEKGDNAEAHG